MRIATFLTAALAVPAALTFSAPAAAAVIIDESPNAVGNWNGGFNASNTTAGQNFLVRFTLNAPTTLTGMSIYSNFNRFNGGVAVGTPVFVRLRSDTAGQPAATNLFTFNTAISAVDNAGATSLATSRLFASFAPTALAAGSYWIGLSGTNEVGWDLRFNVPSNGWVQLSNNDAFTPNNNVQAYFQIEGLTGGVPEPATWAFMILGFGVIGGALRRRKANVTTSVRYA